MKLGVVLTAFAAAAWLNAASPDLRRLPVAYKQNRGQFASDVLFETSGLGQKLSIFRHGVRFQLQNGQSRTSMEMDWADSGASAQVEGEDQLIGASNYLIGSDRQKWISSIPSYQRIRVRGAFPGIDLVLYAKNDRLEYDLVVSPGADVRSIALRFAGADRFEKSAAGDLEVHSGPFTVVQCRPKIYQQSDGKKVEVTGEYVLQQGGQVGFRVSAYRHNEPLVIDPVLSFSTLFGGTGTDRAEGVTLDAAGNIYIVGETTSLDFPLLNPAEPLPSSQNGGANPAHIFVTKLDPTGSTMLFSTYLGGSVGESGRRIAVDASGNIYVAGSTVSPNYPTTSGSLQPTSGANGYDHIALTKISPSGSAILYSAVIGGMYDDELSGLAVDAYGNCFLSGTTNSPDFPTTAAAHNDIFKLNAQSSAAKAFITKVNSTATGLVYSSVIGGSGVDQGSALTIDGTGAAYLAGSTSSSDFPVTAGVYQPLSRVGFPSSTGFVLKLSSDGSAIKFATYLGGSGGEQVSGVTLDSAGKIYVTGLTTSSDFPITAGAYFATAVGAANSVFVSKLSTDGASLSYSALFGGLTNSLGGLGVDSAGCAVVTGSVDSSFPVAAGAPQILPGDGASSNASTTNAFILKLNNTGAAAAYSTYLGGTNARSAAVAVDTTGAAVIAGTGDTTFPVTTGAFRSVGAGQVFVAKISDTSACTYTVSAPSLLSASIATQSGCKWISVSGAPWLAIASGSSGSGSASVQIVAQQNTGQPRSGQLSIAGTLFTVNQAGACQVTLSSTGQSFALDGGSGQFSAFTSIGCPLPAPAPSVSWIHILSNSGTITFSVDRNSSGQSRTGTIAVGTQTLTIFQSSAACSYSVLLTSPQLLPGASTPVSLSMSASASTGTFRVTAPYGCSWNATTSTPWISTGNQPAISGSGTSVFAVNPNPGAIRSGSVIVAGQTFVITQVQRLAKPRTVFPSVWRPSTGAWYLRGNPAGAAYQQWGLPGDTPVPADYDGDGKTDFAVWRPSSATWFVIPSSNPAALIIQKWGSPGDIPVPNDYDGDGRADFAVWHPATGTWLIMPSRSPGQTITQQWGLSGDIPLSADFDGDNKADIAVWRPASCTWYIIPSANPGYPYSQQWGLTGDIPIPADFDGDGKADIAVWRPGNGYWFVSPSGNPGGLLLRQWGLPGDTPVPADYDGDGQIDFAIWRGSTGTWYIAPSNNLGQTTAIQWGLPSDIPTAAFP